MALSPLDHTFFEKIFRRYFADRLGSIQAVNGGGTVTLVAATPALILEQNENRSVATIVNTDAATDCYLNFSNGGAVQGTGILLKANGGAITFGKGSDIPYLGRVWGISVGGPILVFTELSIQE